MSSIVDSKFFNEISCGVKHFSIFNELFWKICENIIASEILCLVMLSRFFFRKVLTKKSNAKCKCMKGLCNARRTTVSASFFIFVNI